jgi:hypothetical protein
MILCGHAQLVKVTLMKDIEVSAAALPAVCSSSSVSNMGALRFISLRIGLPTDGAI